MHVHMYTGTFSAVHPQVHTRECIASRVRVQLESPRYVSHKTTDDYVSFKLLIVKEFMDQLFCFELMHASHRYT